MIIRIIYPISIFIILYIVAYISHKDYQDSEDVLFLSKDQWEGIFLLMLPTLIAVLNK